MFPILQTVNWPPFIREVKHTQGRALAAPGEEAGMVHNMLQVSSSLGVGSSSASFWEQALLIGMVSLVSQEPKKPQSQAKAMFSPLPHLWHRTAADTWTKA